MLVEDNVGGFDEEDPEEIGKVVDKALEEEGEG